MDIHHINFVPPLETNFFGHIVAEIYKDQIYAPFLAGKKDLAILDIGANIGWTSYYFSQFAKQVYSLEPSKQHFDRLVENTTGNGLTNVKPIQKAIFIENNKFPFGGPNNNKTMRSLHAAVWQDGKPDEEVEAITLDKLFEDEKIEHVDFMKADCEGTEYEIFAGEGFSIVAPKIDTIIIERHSWSGRNPHQLDDALNNNGFDVQQIPNDADLLVATRRK